MPRKKIDDILEGRVLALLQLNYSQPNIVKILKNSGINISQQTVSNVKRKIGLQRNSVEKIKFSRSRPAATPSTVSKVIKAIDVEDPPTQCSIAKSCHVSQSTVSRIIKRSNFVLRKKQKVHKLTSSNAEKRRRRALGLYRQLAKHRYKNFITTDETWFYLDGTEGKRKICYIKKSDPNYERMIIQQESSRPPGFMVWAGISSHGKTSLRFVEPGVKVNADYYINKILKPFLSHDVPRLFPNNQKKKMIFHHDNAPSHTSKKTIAFLDASRISYVTPEEWMPKSPDAAPMDYSIWGYLKQQMNKQQIETLDELKKKISYQWKKLDQIYIDKVLAKWPKRIYLIHKARGFHIEHRLKL
jgi:arginine repressor/hemolysin-activating ACP:hemolysin acyltransferase